MRSIIVISFVFIVTTVVAQNIDCRDLNNFYKRFWKVETSGKEWKIMIDSALAACPNNARLWGDKAMGYFIRGEFVEGMEYLNRAAKLDPFYFLGSRAWYRMKYLHDYNGAIKDLDTLEKVAGSSFFYVTNTHMYMIKGQAYQELGDHKRALELYNHAIDEQVRIKGENWVGSFDYLLRGILRYKMNDMEGAIEDLTRQVEEYESLADTYYYRGLAFAAAGRKDEARTDIQQAKDLILGDGLRRWDNLFVYPDEVYLSDIENALLKLY